MYNLIHPNIVKIYNHFEDDMYIYLIIEFASGGQLYNNLQKTPAKKYIFEFFLKNRFSETVV